MKMTRRNFVKGNFVALASFGLFACTNEEEEIKKQIKITEERCKSFQESRWVETGNEKVFDEGEHAITEFVSIYNVKDNNSQINIPEGYRLFTVEEVIDSQEKENYIRGSKISQYETYTSGFNYVFINEVPVIVKEYKWMNKGDVEYPYAGTIAQKKLVKEVK